MKFDPRATTAKLKTIFNSIKKILALKMTEFLIRLFFYNSTVLNLSETLRTCISSSAPQTKKKKNDPTE